tara:strand:+ start:139 stop:1536 length:1398 start_codon:yes stop_codon:yes gene_type:complete
MILLFKKIKQIFFMFRRIEIWILYLTILLSILFAIGFGVLVRQELVGSIKAGWVSKSALTLAEIPVNIKNIFFDDLRVEDRFPFLDSFDGTPNFEVSYLLLSRYDGDFQEGVVDLVDLTNFEVLHTWNPDIDTFNDLVEQVDEFEFLARDKNNKRSLLIHPILLQDGGLLFQNGTPLQKIDSCSNLVFQNTHDLFHHSIETDIDGNIWVPSHIYPQSLPIEKVGRDLHNGRDRGYWDDAISKLSPDGKILYEKSVSQILIENGLEYLLFGHGTSYEEDPIHLNDIQPVNADTLYWKKGDLFLSLRSQSMILLYRPSTNKIIWKGVGPFFRQHDVDIIDNTKISIFNNNFKSFASGDEVDGSNEVIIFDFDTGEYSRYLEDSLINYDVQTIIQGRSEIMPNNDLFIEDTESARTLYFNADGSLRWTHVNRAKNGNVYRIGWSRILYTEDDIQTVNNFLNNKGTCDE